MKEIGKEHVEGDLGGKAFHEAPQAAAAPAQGIRQLLVASTDEDELKMVGAFGIQALGDFEHGVGTLPAKQHQPRGQVGIKPAQFPLFAPVARRRLIKARVQDHARSLKNPAVADAKGARLRDGTVRPADEKLLLRLNPEMRRVIGDVGQDGNEGRGGPRLAQALGERAVEMGNHGDRPGPRWLERQNSSSNRTP